MSELKVDGFVSKIYFPSQGDWKESFVSKDGKMRIHYHEEANYLATVRNGLVTIELIGRRDCKDRIDALVRAEAEAEQQRVIRTLRDELRRTQEELKRTKELFDHHVQAKANWPSKKPNG